MMNGVRWETDNTLGEGDVRARGRRERAHGVVMVARGMKEDDESHSLFGWK
jgi:hypothetical protein